MSTISSLDAPVDYKAYGYASDKPAVKTLTVLIIIAIGGFLATVTALAYVGYHAYVPYTITADPTKPFNVIVIGDQVRERNLTLIVAGLASFALFMITTWFVVSVAERCRRSEAGGRLFGWIATLAGAVLLVIGVSFFNASTEHAVESRYNAEVDSMQAWAQARYGISLEDREAYGLTTINPVDGAPVSTDSNVSIQNKETRSGLILIDTATGNELPTIY